MYFKFLGVTLNKFYDFFLLINKLSKIINKNFKKFVVCKVNEYMRSPQVKQKRSSTFWGV